VITTLNNIYGCDSVHTVTTTLLPSSSTSAIASSCNPADTGIVINTLNNIYGCDSVHTVTTTLLPSSSTSAIASSCNPADTGIVINTLNNIYGCDSVHTVTTTLLPSSNTSAIASSCNPADTGVIITILTNIYGCDSVHTVTTTLLPSSNTSAIASSCNPADTGVVITILTNIYGCDSIHTVTTTLLPSSSTSAIASSCNPADTGVIITTLTNIYGCDSIHTITTSLLPSSNTSAIASSCNPADTGVVITTLSNIYGCDSIHTVTTTLLPSSSTSIITSSCNPADTGIIITTLTNIYGCDSISTITTLLVSCDSTIEYITSCNPADTGILRMVYVNIYGLDSIHIIVTSLILSSSEVINQSICAGSSYLFNGINRTTTGSYLDTLVGSNGCDSFLTLNLTIRPTTTGTINQSICSGSSYLFNGINRSTAGSYLDTLVGNNGCDSFLTLNLTIRPTTTGSINQSICSGSSYLFNGINRSTAGSYLDTLVGNNGCDSFLTLNLTIRSITTGTINQSICAGSSYLFNGINRTTAGSYLDTLVGSNGCDSFLTLNLTIRSITTGTINQSICSGSSYLFNGINRTTAGSYLDTLVGNNGCDSFLTLNLNVLNVLIRSIQPVICEGDVFIVGTSTYTTVGSYIDTILSSYGCDSIVITNLSVIPRENASQTFTICRGATITIGSNTYSNSGSYYDTLTAFTGCDSVLNTILNVQEPQIRNIDTTICSGQVYDGVVYTTSTSYYDTLIYSSIGCDSLIHFININVIQTMPLTTSNDTIVCEGSEIQLIASGGMTGIYNWNPTTNLSCSNCANPYADLTTGTYTFNVNTLDCEGNVLTDSIHVIVVSEPIVNISTLDTCIYLGQLIQLETDYDTSVNSNIIWSVNGVNLCITCPTYQFQPYITGIYVATIYDSIGCNSSDSVEICIINNCGDTTIRIPNFMTPNNDGNNDEFRIENPQNLPITFLRIFNRWGELLFESYSVDPKWDGTYLGQSVNPGVYVYYLEGQCSAGGRFLKTGNISVIK
jgi:gliding motility-associated-like protein